MDKEPDQQPPEPNPYASPQEVTVPQGTQPSGPRLSTRQIIVLAVLGIVFIPIAAFIGGFCCCFSVLIVSDNSGYFGANLMLLGFILGAILGGGLLIFILIRVAKRWRWQ